MKHVVVAALLATLAFLLLAACHKKDTPAELNAYAPQISFSHFRLSVAENMAGTAVYDIRVTVSNNGDRTIRDLEVRATFRDPDGQVVHIEPTTVVNERRGDLPPHQSRDLRMAFEGIPPTWDRHQPELQIIKLELGR